MKKILILLLIALSLTTYAQKNYSIERPLYLGTVNEGAAADSVLVRGADKIVKFVPRSAFGGGLPEFKTINGQSLQGTGEINNSIDDVLKPGQAGNKVYDKVLKFYFNNGSGQYRQSIELQYNAISIANNQTFYSSYLAEDGLQVRYQGFTPRNLTLTPYGLVYYGKRYSYSENIDTVQLKIPEFSSSQNRTLPISVNGNYANIEGNIPLSSITTTFTTNDGKTVTVTNGVITNVQ